MGRRRHTFRIVTWLARAVWDMEAQIKAGQAVQVDADNLNEVYEAVVAGLAVVPGRLRDGTGHVLDGGAECRPEGQDGRSEANQEDFGAHAALLAELIDGCLGRPGQQQSKDEDRDGQEGEDSEKGAREELYVAQLRLDVRVEGVEGVDGRNDDHDEQRHDDGVEELEEDGDAVVPADGRVVRTQDALREDEVHDEEEQDPGVGEDAGGDGDACVARVVGPDDAQHVGRDARHAQAKQQAGQDELVPATAVALEDGHVHDGRDDEEQDEDAADGRIDAIGGREAQRSRGGRIRRSLFSGHQQEKKEDCQLPIHCLESTRDDEGVEKGGGRG